MALYIQNLPIKNVQHWSNSLGRSKTELRKHRLVISACIDGL
jgi:hypothetical protein